MTREFLADRYEFVSLISRGGMGEVWEAKDRETGERVAVKKILEKARRKSVENLLRFKKEAQMLSQLRHRNVVRLLGFGEGGADYYIVMELLQGHNLRQLAETQGPLPLGVFLDLAIQIADGLAFIHDKGIIHRDVKPGNIMIVEEGGERVVKFLDFGIALLQNFEPHYRTEVYGSFLYMSPEQSGILRRPVEPRSDLYSTGILFYDLLAGKPPFNANSVYSLMHQHIASEALPVNQLRAEIPEVLSEIVQKLMNKDIPLRYESADLLARDLREVKKGLEGKPEKLRFVPGHSFKPRIEKAMRAMIGRQVEYQELVRQYNKAEAGFGRVVLITGDAGTGKSRLAEELQEHAIIHSGIALSASFDEYGSSVPFYGYFAALRNFFSVMGMMSKERRERIQNMIKDALGGFGRVLVPYLPELEAFLPAAEEGMYASDRREEQTLFENVLLTLFIALAQEFPVLLLVIDNLQWADQATIALSRRIARHSGKHSLLVVCCMRPPTDEVAIPSPAWGLVAQKNVTNIQVSPFTMDETYKLICSFAGKDEPDFHGLDNLLQTKTGGNAFFLIEYLKLLVRERLIYPNDRWHIDYPAIMALPFSENVASIVAESIKLLDAETRAVLTVAAAWGKEFRILDIVSCFPELLTAESVFRAVDIARERLILVVEPEMIRFSHDICYEVFYGFSDPEEMKLSHDRIARWLMQREGSDSSFTYKIAYHFGKSKDRESAYEYLKKAGVLSQERASFSDALESLLRAFEMIDDRGRAEELWFRERLGETYLAIGLFEESRKHFDKAFALCDSPVDKADVLRKISYSLVAAGNYDEAILTLEQAMGLLGKGLPRGKFARGLATMGHIYLQMARGLFKLGVNRSIADPDSKALRMQKVCQEIGLACLWAMRQDFLMYSHFKALDLSDKAGVSEDGVILMLTHCAVLGSIDAPPSAVRLLYKRIRSFLVRVREDLDALGHPYLPEALYLGVRASVNLDKEAVADARKAVALLEEKGTTSLLQEVSSCAFQVFEFAGDFAELAELAKSVLRKGSMHHNEQLIRLGKLYEGIARYYQGETKNAVESLRSILAELARAHDDVNAQYARIFLFKALCRQQRRSEAIGVAEEAIRTIKARHQTHPMVIARIYPYYLEELIISCQGEKRQSFEVDQYLRRINALYRKARDLAKTYDCHRGMFYRVDMLYQFYVKKDITRAMAVYEAGERYFQGAVELYERAMFHYRFGICQQGISEEKAIVALEHAYMEFDECGAVWEMKRIERQLKTLRKIDQSEGGGIFGSDSSGSGSGSDSFNLIRELDNVLDITKKISVIKDISVLEEETLRHAMELVGAEQGELFVYEGDQLASRRKIVVQGVREYPSCLGVVSKVDYSGEAILVPDASKDQVLKNDPVVLQYGLRSILCVPLISKEKRLGALYLSNQKIDGAFDEREADILKAMAGQAAVAMENVALLEKAKNLQAYFNDILDSMPGAIIALDEKALVTHVNSSAPRLLEGMSRSLVGTVLWESYAPLAAYQDAFARVVADKALVELPREDFLGKYWRLAIFPIGEGGGSGVVIKIEDITDEESMRQQLVQAQKMDAIGTLVSGLAHDFNNILAGILGSTSLLLDCVLPAKKVFTREDVEDDLRVILSSVDRARTLVSQLLTISKKRDAKLVAVNLVTSIEYVLKVCRNSFDKSLEIKVAYDIKEAYVLADPVQLEQVILNLAINAAHAMTIMRPENEQWGGTLTLSIEEVEGGEALLEPGKYWRLCVIDEGVGILEDIRKKIFEPFFTTKDPGMGTGLGLSVAYGIVKSFKGRIEAISERGKGTRFEVTLPAIDNSMAQKQDQDREKPKAELRGEGLVLVVDDEDAVRRSVSKILEERGFMILAAADGDEALALFEANKAKLRYVVLDMVIPKVSSKRVYQEISRAAPEIKFVLMSGFRKDERVEELLSLGIKEFLQKPFNRAELLAAIGRLG